jgi:hypothetical protein
MLQFPSHPCSPAVTDRCGGLGSAARGEGPYGIIGVCVRTESIMTNNERPRLTSAFGSLERGTGVEPLVTRDTTGNERLSERAGGTSKTLRTAKTAFLIIEDSNWTAVDCGCANEFPAPLKILRSRTSGVCVS